MDPKLRDVIRYLCQHYPHKDELSNARLTKMIYLADWEAIQQSGEQITDLTWLFNHYGPYVDDILLEAEEDALIEVVSTANMYGMRKTLIRLKEASSFKYLSEDDVQILNAIITKTSPMYWNEFIKYVYSTPPVMKATRYSTLNLKKAAEKQADDQIDHYHVVF